jgi:hypothetical protein
LRLALTGSGIGDEETICQALTRRLDACLATSECQYYEPAAIDRLIKRAEMAGLRAVSMRAVITPSGVVNHCEWGDLKADPADWMRRYFGTFVRHATRRALLRRLAEAGLRLE